MSRDDFHVLQDRAAGFISRMFAFIIDVAVTTGIVALGGAVAALIDSAIAGMNVDLRVDLTVIYVWTIPFIVGAYFAVFWSLTGRTIGKWFMGLKVVRSDGLPPNLGRAIVRFLGYGVSAVAFWVGFAWVLIDDERQAWHDHFGKTWVVYDYARRQSGEIYDDFRTRVEASD